jgi:hypothetical protein
VRPEGLCQWVSRYNNLKIITIPIIVTTTSIIKLIITRSKREDNQEINGNMYGKTFFCGAAIQRASWSPHSWGFLDHTKRRTIVGRTPLDEWSARRRDLYLTTHNTQNRQISMPPLGFEPTFSAGERPQTYGLDRATYGKTARPLGPAVHNNMVHKM